MVKQTNLYHIRPVKNYPINEILYHLDNVSCYENKIKNSKIGSNYSNSISPSQVILCQQVRKSHSLYVQYLQFFF